MPTEIDPNTLTLSMILTAAGIVPGAALVTGVVQLFKSVLPTSIVAGHERLGAFTGSAVLVVVAYAATAETVTVITGFGAFLAWFGIARLSMAFYDDATARVNSLRGPSESSVS